MNFSLPQNLLVTVIPSASKSDRRPSDWETQGQWDKTSLLCYPSLGPCFQISEACLKWSSLSLPHSPLLPELCLIVQLQTVWQPQKYTFQCQSSIFLRNKSTLKMRTLEVIKRMMLVSQRPVGTCPSLWRPRDTTRTWMRHKEEACQSVF